MPFAGSPGQEVFYDYILVPVLNLEGEVEAVVGTARDITKRNIMQAKKRSK